ncbi:MAG: cytochrome c peroxidase [Nannocystales bacterium]
MVGGLQLPHTYVVFDAMARVRRPSVWSSKSKPAVAPLLLWGLSALAGCSDDTGAAEPSDDGPACIGKCDGFNSITGALPLAPHAATWDGRVLLADVEGECRVVAVRPDAIEIREGGLTFGPEVFSEGLPCPTTVGRPALAMATPDGHNPFPSTPDGSLDFAGAHLTYDVTLLEGSEAGQLVRRAGTLITTQGEVVSAQWDDEPTPVGINGHNPTLSADGGLLVFEREDGLWFALAQGDGFGEPAPLSRLHEHAADSVRGLPLSTRYPLASEALRAADGTRIEAGQALVGQRPSLGQDGTSLFFESEGGTRVLSQRSGFAIRQLDGHINAGNDDAPAFHLSLGRSGSVYAPYPGAHRLPVREHRLPTVSLFGFTEHDGEFQSSYDEIDFVAFSDRDYVTYLPMTATALADGTLDEHQSGDLSGRFNNAVLDPGASLGHAAVTGAHGQAVFLPTGAGLVVPASDSTVAPQRGYNVSMFVRPMADDVRGPLLDWPGVVSITLEDDGVVIRGTAPESEPTNSVHPVLARDTWTHVAVSYDGNSGRLRTYINGERIAQDQFARRGFPTGDGGAITLGRATASGDGAVLALDEVSISRELRFDEEVYAEARQEEFFRRPIASIDRIREEVDLPLGLDAEQFVMPDRANLEDNATELGMLLFFDTRLSSNQEISCATCHDPELAFTDGRPVGAAVDGSDLTRSTPTVFNRALSTMQFWDGRSPSLEQQSVLPIFNSAEMGLTRQEFIEYLESVPEYVDRFNDVFRRPPSISAAGFALAAFQRTQLAGESPVDHYEAGDADALSESEIRGRALFNGKARCVACHSGSNFSDEQLHAVEVFEHTDLGAFLVRRGRERFLRTFKTPTLRNIDVTAPYFHDGSAATLEEVVSLYNAGALPNAQNVDPELHPLGLTADEQTDLVAFLRALTSPNAIQTFDVPLPALAE